RGLDLARGGHDGFEEVGVAGGGHVFAGYAAHGGVEVDEGLVGYLGGDLGAHAAGDCVFVDDEHATYVFDGLDDGLFVPGDDGAQVEDAGLGAGDLGDGVGGFEGAVDGVAPGDDQRGVALADAGGLAEGEHVVGAGVGAVGLAVA